MHQEKERESQLENTSKQICIIRQVISRSKGFSELAPIGKTIEFDRGESAVAAAEVKPWHSAKVEFRVLPPDSKTKNRREERRKMRVIGSEGINSTPYAPMKWEDGREAIALFDTGSQWSLIRKELLTDEERMGLRNNRRRLG